MLFRSDLAGLAWIQQRHPQRYATLYQWLVNERSKDLIAGSHHDTLAWLKLARDGAVLAQPSIFAAAARLLPAGLADDD